MRIAPLLAMIRKDLLLFFTDRRALILSFIVPIAIASFFGSLFSGSDNGEPTKIDVAVIDHDSSTISRSIIRNAGADKNIALKEMKEDSARDAVKRGKMTVAVLIPKGFGDASGQAFFGFGKKPVLQMLYDPSHRTELAMVSGILTQHVMQAVSSEMFSGPQGRTMVDQALGRVGATGTQNLALANMLHSVQGFYSQRDSLEAAQRAAGAAPAASGSATGGLTMPYTVNEQAITSGDNVLYNGYAHSFAGMAVQFLLFAMANMGTDMLLERQKGLWKRLRSAPVSRNLLLAGKVASGTITSVMTLWVCFAFAMIVFHVRIHGSMLGFALISIACGMMAATFGLLVAALGNTPASARAVTTLAVLMMVMLGGAWVPAFIFPAWLQTATKAVPVRWALDGLDSMTWRGLGFDAAIAPIGVLLLFTAVFWIIASTRFRWEES